MKTKLISFLKVILIISILPSCSDGLNEDPEPDDKVSPIYGDGVTDIDGNQYKTVIIGDQEWMAENLITTKLSDGTPITLLEDQDDWTATYEPAYTWYGNYKNEPEGALYNFYSIDTEKLCPQGWHVPDDQEWQDMEIYLGMDKDEASQGHWRGDGVADKINIHGSNETGLSLTMNGMREGSQDSSFGLFNHKNTDGFYWTSSTSYTYDQNGILIYSAYFRRLKAQGGSIERRHTLRTYGFSVRCVKD